MRRTFLCCLNSVYFEFVRELRCLRHKIHIGLFLAVALTDITWCTTISLQVSHSIMITNYNNTTKALKACTIIFKVTEVDWKTVDLFFLSKSLTVDSNGIIWNIAVVFISLHASYISMFCCCSSRKPWVTNRVKMTLITSDRYCSIL